MPRLSSRAAPPRTDLYGPRAHPRAHPQTPPRARQVLIETAFHSFTPVAALVALVGSVVVPYAIVGVQLFGDLGVLPLSGFSFKGFGDAALTMARAAPFPPRRPQDKRPHPRGSEDLRGGAHPQVRVMMLDSWSALLFDLSQCADATPGAGAGGGNLASQARPWPRMQAHAGKATAAAAAPEALSPGLSVRPLRSAPGPPVLASS